MKKTISILACLALALLCACGSGGGKSPYGQTRSLVAIDVSPVAVSLPRGVTQQFQAIGIYSNGPTEDLTAQANWSSSDAEVATVSPAGVTRAVAIGECTVKASVNGRSGERVVKVTPAELQRLEVSPLPFTSAGTTKQFVATGIFTDETVQDLTTQVRWESSRPEIATINPLGLATFSKTGTVKMTASAQLISSSVSASATITVTSATLEKIDISPLAARIPLGTTQLFVALGTFSDKTTRTLPLATWKSSNPEVAQISAAGLATGLAVGVSEITATYVNGVTNVTGSATVEVTNATLTAIQLTPTLKTTVVGTTVAYTATGIYSDHTSQNISALATWFSAAEAVAVVSNASKGVATALAAGTTTISAEYQGLTGSAALRVTGAALVSLTVSTLNPLAGPFVSPFNGVPPDSITVIGRNLQYQATAVYDDNTVLDVTPFAIWRSSDGSVAAVSNVQRGNVTPLAAGSTGIMATFAGQSSSVALTVFTAAQIVSLHVTPSLLKIAKETQQSYRATAILANDATIDVTGVSFWSSSSETVARVSNLSAGVSTGLAAGTTTISAEFAGKSSSGTLTVTEATPVLLRIAPLSITIGPETFTPLVATADFSDGTFQTVSTLATWVSSDEAYVKVSNVPRGVAAGISSGSATITAHFSGLSATATVDVTPATLLSISIEPVNAKLAKGTNRQYVATGLYADNTVKPLTLEATWFSSAAAVAPIENSIGGWGRVTGETAGTTTIRAEFQGVSGTAQLEVTDAALVTLEVTPFIASVPQGYTQVFTATGIFSDSSIQDLTGLATWKSSDETVMTVNNVLGLKGIATAISPGPISISATWNGVSSGP